MLPPISNVPRAVQKCNNIQCFIQNNKTSVIFLYNRMSAIFEMIFVLWRIKFFTTFIWNTFLMYIFCTILSNYLKITQFAAKNCKNISNSVLQQNIKAPLVLAFNKGNTLYLYFCTLLYLMLHVTTSFQLFGNGRRRDLVELYMLRPIYGISFVVKLESLLLLLMKRRSVYNFA